MLDLKKITPKEYHIHDGDCVLAHCVRGHNGQWHIGNRFEADLALEPQRSPEACLAHYEAVIAARRVDTVAASMGDVRMLVNSYDIVQNGICEGYVHRLAWGLWRFVLYQLNEENTVEEEREFDADGALGPEALLGKYRALRKEFPLQEPVS